MQEGPEQVQREEAWSREEQTETETKTGQQLAGKNLRHSRTEDSYPLFDTRRNRAQEGSAARQGSREPVHALLFPIEI